MDWLKNIINKANSWIDTKIFWNKPAPSPSVGETTQDTQTLNEKINTGTINQPSVAPQIESGFSKNLNQQVQSWEINNKVDEVDNSPDVFTSWFLDPREQLTEKQGKDLVQEVQAEESKSWIQKLSEWVNSVNKFIDNIVKWQQADSDYQSKEKFVALSYNPDNWDVYYLDLNDAGWEGDAAQNMFNKYFMDYVDKINTPWLTPAQEQQALMDFYDWTKNMFKIKGDDYYSDGFFFNNSWTRVGRRKDMYSQEQLDLLAQNNIKKWTYVPSFDEWLTYVWVQQENMGLKQDIYMWYGLAWDDTDETPKIDLTQETSEKWYSWFNQVAQNWINELLNSKIGTTNWQARNKAELYYNSIISDQSRRLYQIMAPVYAAEQVVLAKSPSERTEWELELLDTANKFRQMERAAARWLNNWMRQEILYWMDENWDIARTLEVFENWENLSDVLTGEVKKLSWEDWALEWHQSNIDVFSKMANDALYNYNKWKHSWVRAAWDWLEHGLAPAWDWLWEWWQFVAWTVLNLLNASVTWRGSVTSTYLDQDFTVGRLIETDDWNIKRTLKKYALQWVEYVPEVLWNLAPDIIAIAATGWWWAVWSVARRWTKLDKIRKTMRVAEWTSLLSKWRNATKLVDMWKGVDALLDLSNVARNTSKLSQTTRVWLKVLDNAVTQWVIWQLMDAQWSAYDTEPYSDASFWLSMIWTWIWDIWIELLRWWTRKEIARLANKNVITGNVRDLARYIDSSPEAADNIARALWKSVKDASFEELRAYAKNFWKIEEAAKQVYDWLSDAWQVAANKWTKEIMYNYISQAFGSNSQIAKNVRLILNNGWTNIADIVKYIWRIPWDVSVWPFVSTIRLKNGTSAMASTVKDTYDTALDVATWWFDAKLRNWLTQEDLRKISELNNYSNVRKDRDKLFYEMDWKYFSKEEWLKTFWLKAENLSLESLWVTLASAENTREIFKERMKNLAGKNISDDTVDKLADSWWYEEIISKVKEVLWC